MAEQRLSRENRVHFDRQIELLGAESQARLIGSSAVIVGIEGATGEVAKNLALTGLGKLYIVQADDLITTSDVETCSLYPTLPAEEGQRKKRLLIADQLKAMNASMSLSFVDDHTELSCDYFLCAPTSRADFHRRAAERTGHPGLQIYLFDSPSGGVILLCEKDDLPLPPREKIESLAKFDAALSTFCAEEFVFNRGKELLALSSLLGALANQCILLRLTKGPLSFNALTFNFAFPSVHPLSQMKSQTYLAT